MRVQSGMIRRLPCRFEASDRNVESGGKDRGFIAGHTPGWHGPRRQSAEMSGNAPEAKIKNRHSSHHPIPSIDLN
jgi:hypothetical protein